MPKIYPSSPERRNPFLLITSGIFGGLQPHVMERVAFKMGAVYISREIAVSEVMYDGTAPADYSQSRNLAKGKIYEWIKEDLDAGKDVVYNTMLIAPKARRRPLEIAKERGAFTIGLDVHTPTNIALSRVRKWIRDDHLGAPDESWRDGALCQVITDIRGLERVTRQEVDHVMKLDGTRSDAILVRTVLDGLRAVDVVPSPELHS